ESHYDRLHTAGQTDASEVDYDAKCDQRNRPGYGREASQGMQVAAEAKRDVAADEQIASPVRPSHQEAPMSTQHGLGEGVSATRKRVPASQLCIWQGDHQGSEKGNSKRVQRAGLGLPS